MPSLKRKRDGYSKGANILAVYRPFARPPPYKRGRTYGPRGAAGAVPQRGGSGKGAIETKYVDGYFDVLELTTVSNSADATWAGSEHNPRNVGGGYGCLPVPGQGTNYSDRDGRRIFQKTIRINGQITWEKINSGVSPSELGCMRIVIVKDTRTNGVALAGENVIGGGLGSDGAAALSGDGNALYLPSNPDGWGRYKIVADEVFPSPPLPAWGDNTNAGNTNGMITPFKFAVKCKCEVNFNASTGAVGSIVDNSYHFLAIANAADSIPKISYFARTSFTG